MSRVAPVRARRRADLAPCQVIIAGFVFGVAHCHADADHEVQFGGEWYRCCDEHLSEMRVSGSP